MRVWTNGSFARVWVKDKIFSVSGGDVALEEKIKAIKGARLDAPDEVVAWAPTGTRLDPSLEKKRRRVIDARALDTDRVAGIIKEGRGAPRLVIGPPNGTFDLELNLNAPANPVEWPARLLFDPPPWSDSDVFVGNPVRGIRLSSNAQGIGIAASTSGHIAVLRPGAAEPTFVFRVPGSADLRTDAVPTREGALVTLATAKDKSAVLHFSETGALLGQWTDGEVGGRFPSIGLDDERVLAFDRDNDALALLSLPDLDELCREEISDALVEGAATSHGETVVVADAKTAYEVHVDGESLSIDGPFELKADETKGSLDRPKYRAALATGEPQIAFPTEKQKADPPWAVEVGAELAIKMRVRSAAEAGRGVTVEIGGAAFAQGLIRGGKVTVDSKTVELAADGSSARARLARHRARAGARVAARSETEERRRESVREDPRRGDASLGRDHDRRSEARQRPDVGPRSARAIPPPRRWCACARSPSRNRELLMDPSIHRDATPALPPHQHRPAGARALRRGHRARRSFAGGARGRKPQGVRGVRPRVGERVRRGQPSAHLDRQRLRRLEPRERREDRSHAGANVALTLLSSWW